MNDHARILIWDAHTRMGHWSIYAYGVSHTRMERLIRVWANIRIWGRTATYRTRYVPYVYGWLLTLLNISLGIYPSHCSGSRLLADILNAPSLTRSLNQPTDHVNLLNSVSQVTEPAGPLSDILILSLFDI